MDSITQAALGALCGELVLGKKLGNKAVLWGALFGTLPDLDIIAYPLLTSSQELGWHRGISHSILMMLVAAAGLGWLLHKFYANKAPHISYARAAWFVFLAWSTHVLIDCFNTYGTMILEPFSSARISINNMFIIDLFFLVPMLICLFLVMTFFKKNPIARMRIAKVTSYWLCFYFASSLIIKIKANSHFEQLLKDNDLSKSDMITAPTFSNIFLWRMVAQDIDGETVHTSYWSLFDDADDKPVILSLKKSHHLEKPFKDSEDLIALRKFTRGWHKTYQDPTNTNSIYLSALNMGEMHIATEKGNELRPPFTWKITLNNDGSYTLDRAFKMSKDGSKHLKSAVAKTIKRALGDSTNWLKGDNQWSWDLLEKEE